MITYQSKRQYKVIAKFKTNNFQFEYKRKLYNKFMLTYHKAIKKLILNYCRILNCYFFN